VPDALCIAELQDGRRALARINPVDRTAELVLVLHPDDLIPRSMRLDPPARRQPIDVVHPVTGEVVGLFIEAQPLRIPPPPPAPRITADDLIQRGAQLAPGQPITPEDQLLKDILDLRDDDPEAPAIP
jgi:hypothetical protein